MDAPGTHDRDDDWPYPWPQPSEALTAAMREVDELAAGREGDALREALRASYWDADGHLRTRHGLLHLVPDDDTSHA